MKFDNNYNERYLMATKEMDSLVEIHNMHLGLIGRFFEKVFGDNGWYRNAWIEIKHKYNLK